MKELIALIFSFALFLACVLFPWATGVLYLLGYAP